MTQQDLLRRADLLMVREDEARAALGQLDNQNLLSPFMACGGGFTLVFRGRGASREALIDSEPAKY